MAHSPNQANAAINDNVRLTGLSKTYRIAARATSVKKMTDSPTIPNRSSDSKVTRLPDVATASPFTRILDGT